MCLNRTSWWYNRVVEKVNLCHGQPGMIQQYRVRDNIHPRPTPSDSFHPAKSYFPKFLQLPQMVPLGWDQALKILSLWEH